MRVAAYFLFGVAAAAVMYGLFGTAGAWGDIGFGVGVFVGAWAEDATRR